jgi:hypothetical protein
MPDIESLHSASLRSFHVINGDALAIVDPILIAIGDYRAGLADYNERAPTDNDEAATAYAENSYRPPRRILASWDSPALTFEGAVSALKMAKDADNDDDAQVVSAMIRAASGYFEGIG